MVNQSWSKEVLRERLLERYPDGKYIGIPLSPTERYACKKFYNDVNGAFSDMGIIHRKSKEGGVLRLTNKNSIERKNISKINNGLNESESSYINDIRKKTFFRYNNSLDMYLHKISNTRHLKTEEEYELARRIKQGDKNALEKLVIANLKFVVDVAKIYQGRGLELGDLINDGNEGLIEAAKRFDETRGVRFISYAIHWIRQRILKALMEHSKNIRLPSNVYSRIGKILSIEENLKQVYSRTPTIEEIADGLDLDVLEVKSAKAIINNTRFPISIDSVVWSKKDMGSDNDRLYGDIIEDKAIPKPDSNLINDSKKEEIERILKTLTKKEATVIELYFGLNGNDNLSLEEIGEKFDLTRERVRQLKDYALRRLRHPSRARYLKQYLY